MSIINKSDLILELPNSFKKMYLGKKSKELLDNLIHEMCLGTLNYYNKYMKNGKEPTWHPLCYNERVMYSLLAASASKITPVFLSEHPLNRHQKKNNGYSRKARPGRLDLWMHIDRSIDVMIEFKRVAIGLSKLNDNSKVPAKLIENWSGKNGVKTQADEISKEAKKWGGDVIRIGLLVVYGYISSKNELEIPNDDECNTYKVQLKRLLEKLDNSNYHAYCTLPENMRKIEGELNPVIGFVGYIHSNKA